MASLASAASLSVLGLTRCPVARQCSSRVGRLWARQALCASALIAGAVHGLGALGVCGLGKTTVNATLGENIVVTLVVAASGCGRQARRAAARRWQSGRCQLDLLPWRCGLPGAAADAAG